MTEPTQPGSPPPATPPSPPPVSWAPEPSRSGDGGGINDFLAFRYLITPTFITVIYVIGAVLITIGALGTMAGGGNTALGGLFVLIIGNLWWRIVLEFVMVLFRINASLQSIERRGRGM
jgi:hypothetical protein